MPHVRTRGNSHRVYLSVDGQKKQVSVHADELERLGQTVDEWAGAQEDDFRKEIERVSLGLPGVLKLSALFEHFEDHHLPGLAENTRKAYGSSLDRFREFFADKNDLRADQVQTGHVLAFISWRRSDKGGAVGNRTIAKDRTVLHTAMEHGVALGVVNRNPVVKSTRVKHDDRDPYIIEADELDRLLDACEGRPMLAAYVLTLYETGVRSESEGLWLQWPDLDFEYEWKDKAGNVLSKGRIIVRSDKEHRTKGGKGRVIPMTPRLRRALMEHRMAFAGKLYGGSPSPWVFHHTRTRRRATAGERLGSLRRGFEAAVKRAELPERINQHDLRHTRCTRWLADGKPAHVVQHAMGHANIRTTMGYYKYTPDHLRALVDNDSVDAADMAGLGS